MRKLNINELPEIIKLIGENYVFTDDELLEIAQVETKYKIRCANAKLVGNFIKYKLSSWLDRINKIKALKNTITEERYILLMGEIAGKEYWDTISKKKKDSQTEKHYTTKYGKTEGKRIWEDMNSRRGISAFSIEYWKEQGMTEIEAKEKISILSKKGSLIGNKKQEIQRENDYKEWAKKMPNTKHYWIEQGYTKEEALDKVTERQTTFSKKICISKYGKKEGLRRWQERQEKWLDTLDSKSDEEKREIHKKKIVNNFEVGKSSKEAIQCFQSLLGYLKNNNIDYYFGEEGNSEFCIYAYGRYWLYDLTIPSLNLCFEYNGEAFHPNPKWKKEDSHKWDTWGNCIVTK